MIRAIFENGDKNGGHNSQNSLCPTLKAAGVETDEIHKILVFRPLGFVGRGSLKEKKAFSSHFMF